MKKVLFITVSVFFAVITSAAAGEIYSCIDRNGNKIITDAPQDGMEKCVLVGSSEAPANEQAAVRKDNAPVQEKAKPKASEERMSKCYNCCNDKQLPCMNYTANPLLCNATHETCIANCDSEGNTSSPWSDCWSQADK